MQIWRTYTTVYLPEINLKFKSNSLFKPQRTESSVLVVIRQMRGQSCSAWIHWQTYIVSRIFEPFWHWGNTNVVGAINVIHGSN